jgi:anti-sigma regulatory factor (Ser/Thr protein kinase)
MPDRAKPLRHALGAFLRAIEIDADVAMDILTAVGETVVNVIEHAYGHVARSSSGLVEVVALAEKAQPLRVDVIDGGAFVHRRVPRPGHGFGLRIVRAIARDVSIDANDTGTHVKMLFDLSDPRDP